MKNFNFPFLAGVLLTSLAFVPVHFLYNKEAKLRCLENPTYQVAVTTICVHKTFINVN